MAVYTEVSTQELAQFLNDYDIGHCLSFSAIAEGIENSNYLLQTEKGRFILTLFEKRVKTEELPYFMELMEHLFHNGFSCPRPVRGKDGTVLKKLCGKTACLTTFLTGASVQNIQPHHCAELGRAIALMQKASAGFRLYRANDLSVKGWENLIDKIGSRADEVSAGLYDALCREYEDVSSDWPSDLPQSVIHADLFPDNVFFENGTLSGVIDYYFSCNDIAVYELAICLNAWCFDAPVWIFNREKSSALLTAYQALRPMSSAEKEAFPILARGSALRFLLTRTYDWLNPVKDALVTPKNPKEYISKMLFHKTVKSYDDYL